MKFKLLDGMGNLARDHAHWADRVRTLKRLAAHRKGGDI